MAGRRIGELGELVLDRLADPADSLRPCRRRSPPASRCADALRVRVHGRQLRHALIERDRHRGVFEVARHAAFGIAGEIEIEVERAAPLQVAHVDAGLAEPCIAVRHTITRAHWMPVWLRQAPPWPLPQPPGAR